MKRTGYLYNKICSIDNLMKADNIASRGKSSQRDVIKHNKSKESNILMLHKILVEKTYKTSEYYTFTLCDKKEREISRLPYYPDRIVHHAIMNILEPIFVKTFTADTYSCIKKRGIHRALFNLNKALDDKNSTTFCLKLDIKKFYENIDNTILKAMLRKKFKDSELLVLLDEIVDSRVGVPIGNLLSQWFANFYLTYFDHWLKECKKVKYYFRYCDDLVILHHSKEHLHQLKCDIEEYLKLNLKLKLKSNWQIFPVKARGIDFVGYKSYHSHVLLRKSIKKNFIKMTQQRYNHKSICSYYGWIKHCNGINLLNKHIHGNRSIN